jgi:hypothetical protein
MLSRRLPPRPGEATFMWRVEFVVGNAEIVERINLLTVKRHR